jgi:hypothetical protein
MGSHRLALLGRYRTCPMAYWRSVVRPLVYNFEDTH